jgi:hypothetical protein
LEWEYSNVASSLLFLNDFLSNQMTTICAINLMEPNDDLERCCAALEWAAEEMVAAEKEMSELAHQRDLAADALALLTQLSANLQIPNNYPPDFPLHLERLLDPIEHITRDIADLFDALDGSVRYIMQEFDFFEVFVVGNDVSKCTTLRFSGSSRIL